MSKNKIHIVNINNKTNEVICNDILYKNAPWKVKIVFKEDAYGLDNCLTHNEDEPLVEFYDLAHKETFGDKGQFVSRYYLSTILFEGCAISKQDLINAENRDSEVGINLQGNVKGWEMSAPCLTDVLDEIKNLFIKNMLIPHYDNEDKYFKFS
jgi:hypothetical protein|tara:strand:+ start:499 stop:957 length:459 start_codon:yes stop_codon:yes gene_type:complete